MPNIDFKYAAGTVKDPQQTEQTSPAFIDTDNVQFPFGRMRSLPKSQAITDAPKGACRSIWAFKRTGTNAGNYRLYGTHSHLYAKYGTQLYNSTPLKTSGTTLGSTPIYNALPYTTGAANLINSAYQQDFSNAWWVKTNCTITANSIAAPDGATTADSVIDTVSANVPRIDLTPDFQITPDGNQETSVHVKKGAQRYCRFFLGGDGDAVYFKIDFDTSGAITLISENVVNTYLLGVIDLGGGWYRVIVRVESSNINAPYLSILAGDVGVYTGTGGVAVYVWGAQINVSTITGKKLAVTHSAHGFSDGDRIKISGVTGTDVVGVPIAEINKEHIITYVDANTYSIPTTTTPTSIGSGGTGTIISYGQISAGNLNQGFARGFGAGIFGRGIFGAGGVSTSTESFPRIWSFDNIGNDVVMCAGDYTTGDGQKIYLWDGDLDVAATALTNAPTTCNWVSVVNNSVVALCGDTVKISGFGTPTVWSGLTYYANQIQRVWKLLSIQLIDDKNAIIHTSTEALLLQWVGSPNLWDVSSISGSEGIIAPLAFCNKDGVAYWMGSSGQIFAFDGGAFAKVVSNEQNGDWVARNINNAQRWKIFMMEDQLFSQFYVYFPTESATNPTDYLIVNPTAGHFTLGKMDRTAAQRPRTLDSQFVMANGTDANAGTTYRHFMQGDATESWYAETSYSFVADGKQRAIVRQLLPDSNQTGTVTVAISGKEQPQGNSVNYGSWSITPTTTAQTVKAAGKLVSMRFSGTGEFEVGAWKYEAQLV